MIYGYVKKEKKKIYKKKTTRKLLHFISIILFDKGDDGSGMSSAHFILNFKRYSKAVLKFNFKLIVFNWYVN